jgi:hypothetical protein
MSTFEEHGCGDFVIGSQSVLVGTPAMFNDINGREATVADTFVFNIPVAH